MRFFSGYRSWSRGQFRWEAEEKRREARFRPEDGTPRDEAEYCEGCGQWVRKDEIEPNPLEPQLPA